MKMFNKTKRTYLSLPEENLIFLNNTQHFKMSSKNFKTIKIFDKFFRNTA